MITESSSFPAKEEIETHIAFCQNAIRKDVEGRIALGYHLWWIQQHKAACNISNFETFVVENLGIVKATAYAYIKLAMNYSEKDDGNPTEKIDPQFRGMKEKELLQRLKMGAEDKPLINIQKDPNAEVHRFKDWRKLREFVDDNCFAGDISVRLVIHHSCGMPSS